MTRGDCCNFGAWSRSCSTGIAAEVCAGNERTIGAPVRVDALGVTANVLELGRNLTVQNERIESIVCACGYKEASEEDGVETHDGSWTL